MTPLPLPERPSSKLTWIEYSPFFMIFPTRPSRVAERRRHCGKRAGGRQRGRALPSRVLLVALQQLDRNALWAADEANADARPDRGRLLCELDALRPDLGGDVVDVLHRQPE